MMRRVNPTEHQIQSAIVEWARNTKIHIHRKAEHEPISNYLIKIPNEGKRSFFTAKKMKLEGLTRGALDLFLFFPVKSYCHHTCGLWMEVKTGKGKLSESQIIFIERMKWIGYPVVVIRTVDEGIQAIKDYLGVK